MNELERMHAALRPRREAVRARVLIPSLVVVALACVGPRLSSDECSSSDGPQFRCWLEQQR